MGRPPHPAANSSSPAPWGRPLSKHSKQAKGPATRDMDCTHWQAPTELRYSIPWAKGTVGSVRSHSASNTLNPRGNQSAIKAAHGNGTFAKSTGA